MSTSELIPAGNGPDGVSAQACDGRCGDLFYVTDGSRIIRKDKAYEYAYTFFSLERPKEYLYTYQYQEEENWCTAAGEYSSERFLREDTLFSAANLPPKGEGYVRLYVRKTACNTADQEVGYVGAVCGVAEHVGSECDQSRESVSVSMRAAEDVLEVIGVSEKEALAKKEAIFLAREDVAKETARVIRTVQERRTDGCLVFTLLADTHYVVNGNWETCAATIEAVNQAVRPDGIIHLGDLTDGILDKRICQKYSRRVIDRILGWGIPFYMTIGNHDANYFRNNPFVLSEEEQYVYYLKDIVSGETQEKRLWYQADFPEASLRFLFLHSYDNGEALRYGFSDEELEWVEKELAELPTAYRLLLFSHDAPLACLDYWAAEIRNGEKLAAMLDDWNMAHENRIVAFIHGHTHADYIYRARTFPIVSVGCAKLEYFEEMKPEGATAPVRVEGEVSQELWDTLLINPKTGQLDFVRFGAGVDRAVRQDRQPKIWAHRGASGYAPENTLEAFALAEKLGADGVELDVQYTKDRQIVVIHDERIDRVSDGQGYVAAYTLAQLRGFHFNRTHPEYTHAKIPTLREVLELLKPTGLTVNIELKSGVIFYPGLEEDVLRLVRGLGMMDRVIYSSFNHVSIRKIRELDPDAKTGFLYCDGTMDMPEYAVKYGVDALHPAGYYLKYPGFVKDCKEKGVRLHVWTINDRAQMEQMRQLGVDAVITNYPDVACEVLRGERYPVDEIVGQILGEGEAGQSDAPVDNGKREGGKEKKDSGNGTARGGGKKGLLHLAGVTYGKVRKVFVAVDRVVQRAAGKER